MASSLKNLSVFESAVPSAEDLRIAIVVSEWNSSITEGLLKGAIQELRAAGCPDKNIILKRVPGAYELTLACQLLCEHTDVDAVIALGCIIKGETPHFDFIAMGVTTGINTVALEYNTPIAFGVLTTNTLEQAQDRSGGKLGNKGNEAAAAAIKMAILKIDVEAEDE
ncbi:MAG: 6,7-dimethyl-8-ribityllumazine synthase [Rikenellaceae bacterium]